MWHNNVLLTLTLDKLLLLNIIYLFQSFLSSEIFKSYLFKNINCQEMVSPTFNPSDTEVKSGVREKEKPVLLVLGQLGLYREFQNNHGCTEEPILGKKVQKHAKYFKSSIVPKILFVLFSSFPYPIFSELGGNDIVSYWHLGVSFYMVEMLALDEWLTSTTTLPQICILKQIIMYYILLNGWYFIEITTCLFIILDNQTCWHDS